MLEAVVLAGGFGTRLRSIVPDVPKPMASVAGQPFLAILLSTLARKGFSRVVMSLGYQSEKVVSYFGSHFAGLELAHQVEDVPLGTGGAVRLALTRCSQDHVFVFNGDTYLDLEVERLEEHWERQRVPIIVARQVPDTARFGRLAVVEGRVVGFLEKAGGGPGLINAGCYVLPKASLDCFKLGQPFSLENDFLAPQVKLSRIDLFVTQGQFIDIGVPEDYLRAQQELAGVVI